MNRIEVIAELIGSQDSVLHGIEIGCLKGEFAAGILSKFKNLYLLSIDPSPKYNEIYAKILDNNLAAEPKFNLIQTTSDNAIRFLYRKYDFVFIDGDHSYEQTRRDILNYWQVLKPGGILAGHNYEDMDSAAHPGVVKAVKEIFGKDFNLGDDLTWWRRV